MFSVTVFRNGRRILLGLTLICLGSLPLQATAQGYKLPLHIQSPVGSNECSAGPNDCSNIIVDGGSTGVPYDLYIFVDGHTGVLGVELSIQFDPVVNSGFDVFDEVVCSDLQFANADWPQPGGESVYTFATCHHDLVLLGVLSGYAYTNDMVALIPRASQSAVMVTDCSAIAHNVNQGSLGKIAFAAGGTGTGCNPCNTTCTGFTFPCALNTNQIDFGEVLSGHTGVETFTMTDDSGSGTAFDFSGTHPELTFSPSSGMVPPDDSLEITVTWTPNGHDLNTTVPSPCSFDPITLTGIFLGPALGEPMVALHVQARAGKNQCSLGPADYSEIVVDGASTGVSYDLYVVAMQQGQEASFKALEMSLDYETAEGVGVDIFQENACADLSFPDAGWPTSEGSVTYTWDTCRQSDGFQVYAVAAALYVYAYSADVVRVGPGVAQPSAFVLNCDAAGTYVGSDQLGWIPFDPLGQGLGCNPWYDLCDEPIPVGVTAMHAERVEGGALIEWVDGTNRGESATVYKERSGQRVSVAEGACDEAHCRAMDPDPSTEGEVYWIESLSRSGEHAWYGPVELGPAERGPVLSAPLANPAAELNFTFRLYGAGSTRVDVYDHLGRHVAALRHEFMQPGVYSEHWDGYTDAGTPVADGLYFYRVAQAGLVRSDKVMLLR